MIIVSACLAGFNCRWDGANCANIAVETLVRTGNAIPACPEQLGGLSTPRSPAEIETGGGSSVLSGTSRVVNRDGQDVTEQFVRGAKEFLRIAQKYGAKEAILKQGSPSCGFGRIVRKGKDIEGSGVTARILEENGIKVVAID
ncbi:MAG: DUF523 domain-containing protein [Candidatus Eisenbacteria bacterium]|nr:DUF523 domain-containing protein [Candidatus Eisenbacteria bacterium]